jgi:hypothetical protein
MSTADRFWEKVDKTETCWLWTAFTRRGYGRFRVGGAIVQAHRWSYELHAGPVAEGLELDHLCRNKACVNPDHLEPVTHEVNNERRVFTPRTHCPGGHEFTPENTSRRRECRTCHRDRQRRRREAAASP